MEARSTSAERAETDYQYRVDRLTNDPTIGALIRARRPEIITLPTGQQLVSFEHDFVLPVQLPPGYALAGGAARAMFQRLLGEKVITPRDLDVVGISEYGPDEALLSDLSASLMPEDNIHGYGVKIENLVDYFGTRDFYLNEVLAVENKLICTVEALADLQTKTICPTAYEIERWYSAEDNYRYGLPPKLVMKAVRLEAELIQQYGEGEIVGIEDWQWDLREIPLFYIALALDKCQQLGDQTAIDFCCLLLDRGVIDEESVIDNQGRVYPDQLALNLVIGIADRRPVSDFVFRKPGLQARVNRYLAGGNFEDDLFDYYAGLANRSGLVRAGEEY